MQYHIQSLHPLNQDIIMALNLITQPQCVNNMHIMGNNRNFDMGLVIDMDNPNDVFLVDDLTIENCFVPITVRRGVLRVRRTRIDGYGGDMIDVFGGSIDLGSLYGRNNTPTRPYKEYHQDVIQFDALTNYRSDPRGAIYDSIVRSIDVVLRGAKAQGLVFTGSCDYARIQIGIDKLRILLDGYPHLVNAFQLRDTVIGGLNNDINGDFFLKRRKGRNNHRTNNVVVTNIPINPYGDRRGLRGWITEGFSNSEYINALKSVGILA